MEYLPEYLFRGPRQGLSSLLYRAGQVLAISDFEQSPSDGFDELEAEV